MQHWDSLKTLIFNELSADCLYVIDTIIVSVFKQFVFELIFGLF